MHIKRSIKFLLHARKKGDSINGKNLAIRMRISYAGNQPLDFPIGCNVDVEFWDAENQCALDGFVGKSSQKTTDINRTIDEYRSFANEIFARYELLEKRTPTTSEFKDLFNDMTGKSKFEFQEDNHSFFNVFDIFMRTVGEQNQWSVGTFAKFKTTKEHLKEFDEKLTFNKIDEDKLQDFIRFLLIKKDMRNTSVLKAYSFLRWFLRWTVIKGYYNGKAHVDFKPKLKGTDGNAKEIIFLTHEEVKVFQNKTFDDTQKYLERVRDVFLFTCFTGLRYSDVAKLTHQDVKQGFIQIVTQKTADGVRIELNKHSQAILDKYKDVEFKKDKVLPVVSNQKMNDFLKELGRVCELNEPQRIVYFKGSARHEEVYPKWQLLTTHCGRRTFVVNALRLGIPAEVIIRWTGHSDYKAMKPYIKIVDELKEQEMSKFDNF